MFLKKAKDIKINLEDNNNIPIQNYEKIYLKGITYSLNNLLSMKDSNKNIILEIIMIYLIKFKNKDIDKILQENYINMLISLFHQNNLIYLKNIINKINESKYINEKYKYILQKKSKYFFL